MSSTPVIKVDDLLIRSKRVPLIQGLSFEVGRGLVLGVVGTNRSAVRSLIFALAGRLPWDAGRINYVFAGHPRAGRPKMSVSSFLNGLDLPPKLLVKEAFGLYGGNSPTDPARVKEVASLLQLDEVFGLRWEQLSDPLRAKVRLAMCLAGDEELFVLDYLPPETGVDSWTLVRNYLSSLANLGKTVVIATDEPESFCDDVLMIRGPSSFEFGAPEILRRKLLGPGRVEFMVRGLELEAVEDQLVKLGASWIYTDDDRLVVSCANDKSVVEQVVSGVIGNGGAIERVRTIPARLIDAVWR